MQEHEGVEILEEDTAKWRMMFSDGGNLMANHPPLEWRTRTMSHERLGQILEVCQ
jgi:hypothetical protein